MKKLLSITLAIVMLLALTVPAMAADNATVTANVKGNDVTITVTESGGNAITETVLFAKNATQTYDVGGYQVEVAYNGSGVKSAKIVGVPAPIGNNGNGSEGKTGIVNNFDENKDGTDISNYYLVDNDNAQFHCNTFGGNGRVWPGWDGTMTEFKPKGNDKQDKNLFFDRYDAAGKTWMLVNPHGIGAVPNTQKGGDDYHFVCPNCGSDQWITFSNKSGVPDGKNIQIQHPMVDIEIVKVWLDANGNVIKDAKGLSAKFGFAYEIGANKGSKTLGPGKISVPAGTYAINELLSQLSQNYTLVDVSGTDFDIQDGTATITVTSDMALAGGKFTVTFTNKEDPYAIILKEWADGNPDGITALFDIYEYDEDADLCGDLVKADVKAMEKVYVAPGKYLVAEQAKPGYVIQPDQTVEVGAGEIGTVEFVNEPDGELFGKLTLAKTVNGAAIGDWELNGIGLADVMGDMSFKLFKATVDADGAPTGYEGEAIAKADLTLGGDILFEELSTSINGWYAVVEYFTPGSLAEKIFEDVGPVFVFFVDGVGIGGVKADFDYDAYYTIINGYGGGYVLGYPGLNNTGDIFPIGIRNAETGKEYASFCANAGSVSFFEGPGNYMVALKDAPNGVPYADFLKAYNYIEAKYGKLDEHRVVTQIVTWALLGAIDITSEAFDNINWGAVEAGTAAVAGIPGAKEIIEDIIANYSDFVFNGDEEIVDVVFMIGINNADYYSAQPQLVPIYGSNGFDNRTGGEFFSSVWFNKVKYGGVLEVLPDEFSFDLFKIMGEDEILIGTFNTGFGGMVFIEKLDDGSYLQPGDYVFREEIKLFWDEPFHGEDGDYNLVWKPKYPGGADGLYFTIDAQGNTVWPGDYELDDANAPTVNNVAYCKHAVFWNNLDFYYGTNPHKAVAFEGGWLIWFDDFCTGELEITGIKYPTCEDGGIVWLKCTDCEIGTGVAFGEPLGHDYQPTGEYVGGDPANGEWYVCTHDNNHKIVLP